MKPAQLRDLVEALLAPIPGDDPAGRDLKYEPIYDQIKAARRAADDKLSVPHTKRPEKKESEGESGSKSSSIEQEAPAGPGPQQDWLAIEKLTTDALAIQSKDLQVAVWLLEVETRLNGFEGAAISLQVLRELIDRYWAGLYPQAGDDDDEPLGRRAAVMNWIEDREKFPNILKSLPLTPAGTAYSLHHYEVTQIANTEERQARLQDGWPSAEDFRKAFDGAGLEHLNAKMLQVSACQEELARLTEMADRYFVTRKTPDDPVKPVLSFARAREVLETCHALLNHAVAKKRPPENQGGAAEPQPASENASGDVSGAAPTPASGMLAQTAEPVGSRDQAIARLAPLAEFLLTESLDDPTPYLLSRAIAFGPLYGQADLSAPDVLSGPPSQLRERLRRLAANGEAMELLQESERFLRTSPMQGWLDLHRYAVAALRQCGNEQVAGAIESQVEALLSVHPELTDAEFTDGTPVANVETQKWLREAGLIDTPAEVAPLHPVSAPVPIASQASVQPASGPAAHEHDYVENALELARGGRTAEALAILQGQIDAATSGRERFLRKLELAEVCLQLDRAALAFPLLDELAGTIERAHLEDWEDKALVVRSWMALVRCCRSLDSNAEAQTRGKQIFDRLCRLDSAKALSIDKDAATSPSRWRRR